ncbi:hypothetical protein HS125_01570 [bacterium]|nr:hypothetical protein [bacterium]
MRIPKRKVRTALHIDQWIVEGYLHLLPGEEFASFSAGKRHRFIPVTSARIYAAADRRLIATTDLLEVNGHRVMMFYPLARDKG